MSGIDPAKYRFVPYARRGFRSTDEFTEGSLKAGAQPSFGVTVSPKAKARDGSWTDGKDRSLSLSMYGPGDVQGVDDAQIVRVEPEPDSGEFQPNYFPFVEFDRPDLPWMFSPERADESGRIRPWLSLIVVSEAVANVSVGDQRPCPVLELTTDANLATELPDLRESWAWAHVQVHGTPEDAKGSDWYGSGTEPSGWLYEELQERSNLTVSRLLAPRNLKPQTDYVACLVPTFDAGRRAGLGENPFGDKGRAKAGDAAFAWEHGNLPDTPFELPLYHYWRFTSGRAGTFENLVKDLSPVELGPDVGAKTVNVRDPGPDSLVPAENEPTSVQVGGAMCSVPAKGSLTDYEQSDALRQLLNKPETLTGTGSGDAKFPIVGPPLYGEWHAGLAGVPAAANVGPEDYDPSWFRGLNLNVRNRVAASVGGGVVQEYQEQLMDAAWEVVGKVRKANRFTRNTQGAGAAGDAIELVGEIEDQPERRTDETVTNPGQVRREFDRLREIADVAAAGGIEGITPDDVGGGDGGLGGSGPPTAGGGDDLGGMPVGGGDGTGTPPVGGGAVDPIDGVSLGGGATDLMTGTEMQNLSRTYADAKKTMNSGGSGLTDGGTATTGPGGSAQAMDTAVYTEYLRTFLSQPETSLQFQRLTRLDGPLAKRTGFGQAEYRRAIARAATRSKQEVETLATAALADPSSEPTDDRSEGSPGFGENMLVDPQTIASLGSGAPSGGLPGEDAGGPPADPTGGQGSGTDSGAPDSAPKTTTDPESPESGDGDTLDASAGAVPPANWLSRRPATVVPKTRSVETTTASAAALDARVADSSVRPADDDGDAAASGTDAVRGALSGLREHCDAVEERIGAARSSLAEDTAPASSSVLAAYEAAQPIAYSLDPLRRTLSKALADPDVEVADPFTEPRLDDEMATLRESYRTMLSALTTVHEALSGGGEGEGAEPDGGKAEGATSDSSPRQSLDEAERALTRFRGVLDALEGLSSPVRTVSMPEATLPDAGGSALSSYAPTTTVSTTTTTTTTIGTTTPYTLSLDGIGTTLQAGGESRFRKTMLSRRLSFTSTRTFVQRDDPVDRVMVAPEFPTPTWRLLKEYDETFLLPGADSVQQDSVGLVVQNREFIESYMVGLSHEMGRELLWRRYPTDKRGTYFRRFWNRGEGPAWDPGSGFGVDEDVPEKDITEIHEWDTNDLGVNAPGGGAGGTDKVVLLVRGKLFDRYPNAVVYAARAKVAERNGELVVDPVTPEKFVKNADYDQGDIKFPIFRGQINADTNFLGFDLTYQDVYANESEIKTVVEGSERDREALLRKMADPNSARANDLGWYFVFEERPGETRFGLDEGEPSDAGSKPSSWDDLTWYHTVASAKQRDNSYLSVADSRPGTEGWSMGGDADEWGKNGAHMAGITWQKPVRVSYHAHEMLPDQGN